jgi:hypothetical protein
VLLIRERDREREGFPWSHGQIAGESPAGTGEIPDRALTLEQASVVRDGTLRGEVTVRTNCEGRRGLAGRRIVGREQVNCKEGLGMMVFIGGQLQRSFTRSLGGHGYRMVKGLENRVRKLDLVRRLRRAYQVDILPDAWSLQASVFRSQIAP